MQLRAQYEGDCGAHRRGRGDLTAEIVSTAEIISSTPSLESAGRVDAKQTRYYKYLWKMSIACRTDGYGGWRAPRELT